MSEERAVRRSEAPVTEGSLSMDLAELGVAGGDVLLVHSSLSGLGWVCGGAVAVLRALVRVLGEDGTLVMPAQSSNLSEPSHWVAPPVPPEWFDEIRRSTPAFDPALTPTRGMGAVSEAFRSAPGVQRSQHPTGSFCAAGPLSTRLLGSQPLADPFGEHSPLAELYRSGAKVLMLAVDYDACTLLHYAERRAFGSRQKTQAQGAPLEVAGERRWVEFSQPDVDSADFIRLGRAFEAANVGLRTGRAGAGRARLIEARALVDFAVDWLEGHRAEDGTVAFHRGSSLG